MMSTGGSDNENNRYHVPPPVIPQQLPKSTLPKSSNGPAMCMTCGLRTELNSMRYSYSEIQIATDEFSSANLLGEGGYGPVYLGRLKDGQRIAAKVQREASTIGSAEFHSEVYVLSFARHKNIVMLLGHCSKDDLNILVYEYICNKSLSWHLFGKYIYEVFEGTCCDVNFSSLPPFVSTKLSDFGRKYRACS